MVAKKTRTRSTKDSNAETAVARRSPVATGNELQDRAAPLNGLKTTIADHPAGMGAFPAKRGIAFRLWAPNATAVSVVRYLDNKEVVHEMTSEQNGNWFCIVNEAKAGDEYRYRLDTPSGQLSRIDPYAREVTSSVGNSVVYVSDFDWSDDQYKIPNWNELAIYEMHIGTFNDQNPHTDAPASFDDAIAQFDHLKRLGVNCIQVMPIAEFAGDRSWGYNPAHIFAVEQAYGGPNAFKRFVKEAHRRGFAVILDVVYNHFGPGDLHLWQFDGWSENDGGGIYFYNDWRRKTPWGDSRPDYGRGEVRQFIRDNALMWIEDFHVDGLRYDMTLYIRSVDADGANELSDGWSLMQWINRDIEVQYPGKIIIAEDLQNNEWLTRSVGAGGAGFKSQWDAGFVHPIRAAVIAAGDEHRSMDSIANAIRHNYNNDAFQRVIYSESHDEVANGRARVPHEIDGNNPTGWFAKKRSTLAAALVKKKN